MARTKDETSLTFSEGGKKKNFRYNKIERWRGLSIILYIKIVAYYINVYYFQQEEFLCVIDIINKCVCVCVYASRHFLG